MPQSVKFVCVTRGKDGYIEATTTHEVEDPSLPDMLEAFESFLRGMGFHFPGEVVIVEMDPEGEDPEGDEEGDEGTPQT